MRDIRRHHLTSAARALASRQCRRVVSQPLGNGERLRAQVVRKALIAPCVRFLHSDFFVLDEVRIPNLKTTRNHSMPRIRREQSWLEGETKRRTQSSKRLLGVGN